MSGVDGNSSIAALLGPRLMHSMASGYLRPRVSVLILDLFPTSEV